MRSILNRYLEIFLNLVFPPHCLLCEQYGAFICSDCYQKIRSQVSIKESSIPGMTKVISLLDYDDPIKHLIWLSKFREKKVLIPIIGTLLAEHFPVDFNNVDMIIPVPIHPHRLKERGFNQAVEFIKIAAQQNGVPLQPDIVVRNAETHALYELGKKDRLAMMQGTMICTKPEAVQGKNILLFDDIITTGATLQECVRVLRETGCGEIVGLTLCKA